MSDDEKIRDAIRDAQRRMREKRGDTGDLADRTSGLDKFRAGVKNTAYDFNQNWVEPDNEEWVIDKDGNWVRKPKVWLLNLIGDEAYSLGVGEIMHSFKSGLLTDAIEFSGEKILGLQVMGRSKREFVANDGKPHVIFDWMQRQSAFRYGAYALLLGHRAGIQAAQQPDRYGSVLFDRALSEWQFSSPIGKLAALEVFHDLMPEELKPQAKSLVNTTEIGETRRSILQSQSSKQQPLYLTSGYVLTDRLFPEIFIPQSHPPEGLNHPIPSHAINMFKSYTLQRIDATMRTR